MALEVGQWIAEYLGSTLLAPSSGARFHDTISLLSKISALTMISRDGLGVWVDALHS